MIRSPEKFAIAFAAAAEADLLKPELARRRLAPRELEALVRRDLADEVRGISGKPQFPHLRAFVRTWMNVEEARKFGGLSQWDALASVITSATNLASKYYTTKLETETQTKIMEYQVQSQQLAQQALDLQARNALLRSAAAEGAPQAAIAATVSAASRGESPSRFPIIPVAIGAGAVFLGILYFVTRR